METAPSPVTALVASAAEIRTDLQRLKRDTESGHTSAQSVPAPAVKFPWWRKKVALVMGAALATLLLVAGWFAFFRGRGEAIDSVAVLPFANASVRPKLGVLKRRHQRKHHQQPLAIAAPQGHVAQLSLPL